jgi:hypothetical protein
LIEQKTEFSGIHDTRCMKSPLEQPVVKKSQSTGRKDIGKLSNRKKELSQEGREMLMENGNLKTSLVVTHLKTAGHDTLEPVEPAQNSVVLQTSIFGERIQKKPARRFSDGLELVELIS